MYFYHSLLLISNILILTVQTQFQIIKGPGISACSFFGYGKKDCDLPDVDISSIPAECTSIIYNGVYVDLNYHVCGNSSSVSDDAKTLGILDKILKACKRTYLYYSHYTQEDWTQVLSCEACNGGINSIDEMKGIKAFLDEHQGITGLILSNFENNDYSIDFPGYSENLKKYLEVMKSNFPHLEIGIEFEAKFLIDQFHTPEMSWLDIKVIDADVDFYVISVVDLNDCDDHLENGGVAPMTSKSTNYTLDTIKCTLPKSSIPKEKTYFKFRLNPTSDPNDSLTRCNLTIQAICTTPIKTCSWCSDDQLSFNEKGKFVKENGVGFLTTSIDLNDPTNLCKCEKPYASFYALLAGFNGATSKPCNLFTKK